MAYPAKLLAPGESIHFETRPHWRGLLAPSFVFIVAVFITSALYFWIDTNWFGGTALRIVIAIAFVFVLILWALVPFLRWLTTDYVFTDRRIIVRSGIITRQGRDMPLAKINDISFSVSLLGRILNYGRLDIQSAGENEGLTVEDVPDVEEIQRNVYEFIERDDERRRSSNPTPPPEVAGPAH